MIEKTMRSEDEMMKLILQVAEDDERVRAVYLNGSRTNPNAPKDCFQDYDVVYVVTETKPYYENLDWVKHFGTILYMQMPEYMDKLLGKEICWDETFGWLAIRNKEHLRALRNVEIVFAQGRMFDHPNIYKNSIVEAELDKYLKN